MALVHVSASLALSINADGCAIRSTGNPAPFVGIPRLNLKPTGAFFISGSTLLVQRSFRQRKHVRKANSGSVRCEQRTQESSSVDVWVGRLAMVSFTLAITAEITTGKGLLENLGLPTPLPTVALAVTALVVALFAVFITQSASKN